MGINKYNCEGYYDPTPYEALTRIENEARKLHSFRPVVYICSPLSGDVEGNQEKTARYCRFAVDTGYIPIAPHLYFPRFMDDANPRERDLALFMDIVLLTKCAQLWVFGDTVSKGMSIEIEKARRKGQTIRYFKHPWKAEVSEDDTGVLPATISGWYEEVYEPDYSTLETA